MRKILRVIFLFFFLNGSIENPIVLDQSIEYCSYTYRNNDPIQATGEIFSVKHGNVNIHYRLCSVFGSNSLCPEGSSACIQDGQSKKTYILGSSFEIKENNTINSVHGSICRNKQKFALQVHLKEDQNTKPHYIENKNENQCNYHLAMYLPVIKFACKMQLFGKFFNIMPLARDFTISSPKRNFSVSLCGVNPDCEDGVNACEKIGNFVTPISLKTSLNSFYDEKNNQIGFQGETHKPNMKKIKILFVCNSEKSKLGDNDLRYIQKKVQGSKYDFELETSFGCVKKSTSCLLKDQHLVYNLTGLNSKYPNGLTVNGNGNSIYFIQLCEPLTTTAKNGNCKNSYAQICENVYGQEMNKGSFMRHLKVQNEVLVATIDWGSKQCVLNNSTIADFYKTVIQFSCDFKDYGPKFLSQTNCVTNFVWKTPHACPKWANLNCNHLKAKKRSCIFNEVYNLTSLGGNTSIMDKNNTNLQFILNICGPVDDEDLPCNQDISVILKDLSVPNTKLRSKSLGKFSVATITNSTLLLNFTTGYYCDGMDYTSTILFECINIEEQPILIKEEKCHYEFLWRTIHSCPHNLSARSLSLSCPFQDTYHIKDAKFEVDINDYKMNFDICNGLVSIANFTDIEILQVALQNATWLKNATVLEFTFNVANLVLPNLITLNFLCDKNENHERWETTPSMNGSQLHLEYFTSEVCSKNEDVLGLASSVSDPYKNNNIQEKSLKPEVMRNEKSLHLQYNTTNESQDLQQKQMNNNSSNTIPNSKLILNCTVKSPYTKFEINLNDILKNKPFQTNCPQVIFNNTFHYVTLLYQSFEICDLIPSKSIVYEAKLLCLSNSSIEAKTESCVSLSIYKEPEFCNFFESQSKSNNQLLIIILSIIGFIVLIGLVAISVILRKRCSRHGSDSEYSTLFSHFKMFSSKRAS
ncbi:hypothetical protein ABEB36_005054 [Hypothenemus hampei]|uniref:MRH domain-containing protein n=1 Tax=Hypothenemus hampei TaxID=57062 RepID=A0ABD1EWT2_HYPHA